MVSYLEALGPIGDYREIRPNPTWINISDNNSILTSPKTIKIHDLAPTSLSLHKNKFCTIFRGGMTWLPIRHCFNPSCISVMEASALLVKRRIFMIFS